MANPHSLHPLPLRSVGVAFGVSTLNRLERVCARRFACFVKGGGTRDAFIALDLSRQRNSSKRLRRWHIVFSFTARPWVWRRRITPRSRNRSGPIESPVRRKSELNRPKANQHARPELKGRTSSRQNGLYSAACIWRCGPTAEKSYKTCSRRYGTIVPDGEKVTRD